MAFPAEVGIRPTEDSASRLGALGAQVTRYGLVFVLDWIGPRAVEGSPLLLGAAIWSLGGALSTATDRR